MFAHGQTLGGGKPRKKKGNDDVVLFLSVYEVKKGDCCNVTRARMFLFFSPVPTYGRTHPCRAFCTFSYQGCSLHSGQISVSSVSKKKHGRCRSIGALRRPQLDQVTFFKVATTSDPYGQVSSTKVPLWLCLSERLA